MRLVSVIILIGFFATSQGQLYVLKDHRPDSNEHYQQLFDSLPEMCDSFYITFLKKDLGGMKKFVPQVKYLRATFDTMSIEYREDQVIYRQQMILRNLQKDYRKILKNSEKSKLKLKRIERGKTQYNFGKDDDNNRYCYVTVNCKRRKHQYELKYLAILLNGSWFVGDELNFKEIVK
ncbi:MAG: hypothetical protein COA58_12720 [Bacteroidetes bacterium]|nr:MAG: hypothetical protein COA58_12720 [Bacteroidota bacterium]